tara:strand:+ start:439 stop:1050 length:612 start_codon:yes stop_codon:yes gene_type:complete
MQLFGSLVMLIAVDIDDVIAEFMDGFIQFHNEKYGTSLVKKDLVDYSFWRVLKEEREEGIKRIYNFIDSSNFKEILPAEGAFEVLNLLKEENELVIITSRPKSFTKQTEEWIKNHFPGIFSKIHFSYNRDIQKKGNKTKNKICEELKVDIFIEDSLEYSEECVSEGTKVLLLNKPWNQREELPHNLIRIQDWNEVLSHTLKST